MIYINQVFQYVTDSKRIRVIDIEEPHVYIVNIDTSSAMPRKELYSSLTTDIKQGELLAISDPYAKMISEGDLTEEQIRKREEDWETIQKYCVTNLQELLRTQWRENKSIEVVSDSHFSKTKIKKLLTRYCQRGMTKNAMLPNCSNSGGKSKTKALTKEKVRRPRRVNLNNEYQTGINITEEVKVQIEHVINKYYRKKNNYSLKDVYNFMLRDFYSDRYKENGELKYRIWDATRTPSYHQFYYWFKKLEDPKKDIQFRKSTKEYELKHRPILGNSK